MSAGVRAATVSWKTKKARKGIGRRVVGVGRLADVVQEDVVEAADDAVHVVAEGQGEAAGTQIA